MEHKFVHRVSLILYQVVIKGTLLLWVVDILVVNWFVSWVCRALVGNTLLTEENLRLTIQFKHHIVEILFIEEHLPIQRVHIWSALAE